ncbi:TetR/AcrR family transcriptional regulator [Bradyrhizobium erythrophlei]|uniref:TetR/AcrR family transcriptional regulator n=1 Tax=Bradyrhizobium erythrophlei TaxID=1437360 RepID=UPI0035E8BA01
MPRTTDAREKAIQTAERLFRTQGYAATGLTQILEESSSPKGSFYFHFPGGKRELAMEVIAAYRATTTAAFRALAARAAGDPDKFVRALANAVAEEMSHSGWVTGCVAQNLAQELAPGDGEIADALAALFNEWVDIIAATISAPGKTKAARSRATALVAALEGARTLARAQRSAAPFDAVISQFRDETAADRRA